jgi:hypothetical protein
MLCIKSVIVQVRAVEAIPYRFESCVFFLQDSTSLLLVIPTPKGLLNTVS